jgi:hypothetical protein
LDFVGGENFNRRQLDAIQDCLEHYIGGRYGLEVRVKTPKALKHEREHADLNIDKWQVSVITAPGRKHIPQQRIKIEVANVNAYSREPQALNVNYDFLPDGYADTLVLNTDAVPRIFGALLMLASLSYIFPVVASIILPNFVEPMR